MKVKARLTQIPVSSKKLNSQCVYDGRIKDYAGRPTKPPPILVARNKKKQIYVLDGFHRLTVAKKTKCSTIAAWVVPYSKLLKACWVNLGLKTIPYHYGELDADIICGNQVGYVGRS